MQKFYEWKLKRFEKKMKKLKPELLNRWYDKQEEQIRKEFEEELDRTHGEVYLKTQTIKELTKERDSYKYKYEAIVETQDKLLNKVEKVNTDKGQLKQEVKQVKQELSDTKEQLETKQSEETN